MTKYSETDDEPDEGLIQQVASAMATMDQDKRDELAKSLGMTREEFNSMVENWKKSRH
jgi:hypothetical protein